MNVAKTWWMVMLATASWVAHAQAFEVFNTGSSSDGLYQASGGVCLMGGASENDDAMAWFLERAGGGDVLVLRASGSDGYNDYLYNNLGVEVNRVTTVVCQTASASFHPDVLALVNGAEAIWFAGGNQALYHNLWQGTPLNEAINEALAERNIVIGGTSAGMAILGGLRFEAQNGTVYSDEALENPYNTSMTLDNTPFIDVPVLANTFTETHFDNPDRKGRLLTFMARAYVDWGIEASAIACDEYTAVCIDENGLARVFGEAPQYLDNAYFARVYCLLDDPTPEVCEAGLPLTWSQGENAVRVWRTMGTVSGTPQFHLYGNPMPSGGNSERWWAEDGTWSSEAIFTSDCPFNPPTPCNEDIDGDGFIATSDVVLMLTEFGCNSGCQYDLDGDNTVGVTDLLMVLSRFGEAC